MTTDADTVIAALHAGDDELAPVVAGLTPEQLTGPSAASEWSVAQVLSHLGSGATITLATFEAALSGQPTGGSEANQAVWDRWNAMGPQEQAAEYVVANTRLLDRLDAVDAATRESQLVDMGFLPAPVPFATALRFRLNEFALHSWDVRVALDPAAVVHPAAPPLLLDQVAFLLGWIAKPAAVLAGREVTVLVRLTDVDRTFGLALGESAAVTEPPAEPDAVLTATAEAWLRLATGRLAPEHTPAGVEATGALTLDELRQVFPGF